MIKELSNKKTAEERPWQQLLNCFGEFSLYDSCKINASNYLQFNEQKNTSNDQDHKSDSQIVKDDEINDKVNQKNCEIIDDQDIICKA